MKPEHMQDVGPLDSFMTWVAGFETWLRVAVSPVFLRFTPMWVTPNMVTTFDIGVVSTFAGLSAYLHFLDPVADFWLKFGITIFICCLMVFFCFLDVYDGDLARARNMCSQFGAAYDHFTDSAAAPLTVLTGCLSTNTPPYLIVFNLTLLVITFFMQAVAENKHGKWLEPTPGGCGATLLSVFYILLSLTVSTLAHLDLITRDTASWFFLGAAWFAALALVPTMLTMVAAVGRPLAKSLLYGTSIIVCIALTACTVDSTGSISSSLSLTASNGGCSIPQFLLLAAAFSLRHSGICVLRSVEGRKYYPRDIRSLLWVTVIFGVFLANKLYNTFEQPSMQQYKPLVQALPFLAFAEMVVSSGLELYDFSTRVSKRSD